MAKKAWALGRGCFIDLLIYRFISSLIDCSVECMDIHDIFANLLKIHILEEDLDFTSERVSESEGWEWE